jgi:hypothetical protein
MIKTIYLSCFRWNTVSALVPSTALVNLHARRISYSASTKMSITGCERRRNFLRIFLRDAFTHSFIFYGSSETLSVARVSVSTDGYHPQFSNAQRTIKAGEWQAIPGVFSTAEEAYE